jgi:pimeloyl-ACP methyl ester carboxylesterase
VPVAVFALLSPLAVARVPIPGAKLETVANGGHFLSLDQPERLAELIKLFTSAQASQATKLGPDDRV